MFNTDELENNSFAQFDRDHIWHPYGPMPATVAPYVVAATNNTDIILDNGTRLIDGMSSWWAAAFGHGNERLKAAAHRQIDVMSHVMFGGLTHVPAIKLACQLCELTDEPLTKVFFSDSGSVAVEVALKMVYQYQLGQGHPERRRMLTWRGGYHGDTFATMSLCDPEGGMHAMWERRVMDNVFASRPPLWGAASNEISAYIDHLDSLIDSTIAGIIVEPVVQGAGGMRFHAPEILKGIRQLCDQHGILFIADEIATGFGRTGNLFATQAAKVTPDILCVGKSLTGGFMSLAATITTDAVAESISSAAGGGALMHGPTFMGNPLACAVASEALSIIAEGDWKQQVAEIESELKKGLVPLASNPAVRDVRVLGAIGVVEMKEPVDMKRATHAAVNAGVWLRPFGRLVYTMPPFVCTHKQIQKISCAMASIVHTEQERFER